MIRWQARDGPSPEKTADEIATRRKGSFRPGLRKTKGRAEEKVGAGAGAAGGEEIDGDPQTKGFCSGRTVVRCWARSEKRDMLRSRGKRAILQLSTARRANRR